MKHDPKFIAAWEKFTGLEWAEDYQGGFALSFRDFKAGWDACECHLTNSLSGRAKKCGVCGCFDVHAPWCSAGHGYVNPPAA